MATKSLPSFYHSVSAFHGMYFVYVPTVRLWLVSPSVEGCTCSDKLIFFPVVFLSYAIRYHFSLFVLFFRRFFVILEDFYNLFRYRRLGRMAIVWVTNWQPCLFLRFAVRCFQVTHFRFKDTHFFYFSEYRCLFLILHRKIPSCSRCLQVLFDFFLYDFYGSLL